MSYNTPRNKLKSLRDRSRLSLSEVALLTGYDPSTISKHESGSRSLSPEATARYSKLYKVESYELFYLDGEFVEEPEE